jgi:hypothetical protein
MLEERAMGEMSERDTERQDAITCPYCGSVDEESWESNRMGEGPHKVECGDCERTFSLSIEFSVTYSTEKIEPVQSSGQTPPDGLS